MTPIQEIELCTSNTVRFSAHIVAPNQTNIGAEVIIYDPRVSEVFSSYHEVGQYKDVNSAYGAIIDFCKKYSSAADIKITKINNPCNTEFIDKMSQQSIVYDSNLNISVEVNA